VGAQEAPGRGRGPGAEVPQGDLFCQVARRYSQSSGRLRSRRPAPSRSSPPARRRRTDHRCWDFQLANSGSDLRIDPGKSAPGQA
jgi:hypothetical protein